MVKVDEFDAVDTGLGSLVVTDEEEGDWTGTSSDSTTTAKAQDGRSGGSLPHTDQSLPIEDKPLPPSNCEFAATCYRDGNFLKVSEGVAAPRAAGCSSLPKNDGARSIDADIEHMFRRARQLRHHRYKARPYGILGLYQHLCDIRQDYEWANTAVARRQLGQPYLAWIDHHELMLLRNPSPTRTLRWFGYLIIVASTALLLASFAVNDWRVESMSVNSMVGSSAAVLLQLGALQRSSIVVDKQWYRIVTAIPLHAGVVHWLMNGAAMLWMCRSCLRPDRFSDSRRFIGVFVVAAVAGNLCSAAYSPFTVSMGASGGMFGWLGCCLADVVANFNLLSRSDDGYVFPRRLAIAWLVLEVLLLVGLGMTPYVDNFAHMGGFVTGIGIEWSFKSYAENPERQNSTVQRDVVRPRITPLSRLRRCWAMILVLFFLMFHVVLLGRSTSNLDVCKKCRYVSCVPFPFWTTNQWWHCDSCEHCSVRTTLDGTVGVGVVSGTSWLEITCPYGDVLRRPYPEDLTSSAILSTMVPETCRQSCSL